MRGCHGTRRAGIKAGFYAKNKRLTGDPNLRSLHNYGNRRGWGVGGGFAVQRLRFCVHLPHPNSQAHCRSDKLSGTHRRIERMTAPLCRELFEGDTGSDAVPKSTLCKYNITYFPRAQSYFTRKTACCNKSFNKADHKFWIMTHSLNVLIMMNLSTHFFNM